MGADIGGQVERAGYVLEKGAESIAAQADALVEARGLTALQGDGGALLHGQTAADGTRTPGYLETRGEAAMASAADVLASAHKRRAEIAAGMNERQRARFLQRSDAYMLSLTNTVEQHSAQQFQAAKKATALGLRKETLKSIQNNPADPALGALVAEVEASTRGMQLSKEDGDADVAQWKAEAATAQVTGFLQRGDIEAAEAVVEAKGDELGAFRDEVLQRIKTKKNEGRIQREQTENEITVSGIMEKAAKDGVVDQEKALELLDEVPPDRFTEVSRLFQTRLRLYEHAQAQAKKQVRAIAGQQMLERRSLSLLDPGVIERLKAKDYSFYKRLERDEYTANRRAKAGGVGRREQNEADQRALWRFRTALLEDPDIEPLDWAAGEGVSDKALDKMGYLAAQAKRNDAKADVHGLNSFVASLRGLAPEFKPKGNKPAKYNPEQLETFLGRGIEAYQEWKAAHDGAEPSPEEVLKIKNSLMQNEVVEEHWYGDKKAPAFLAPHAAVAQPQPKSSPKSSDTVQVIRRSDGKSKRMSRAEASKLDSTKYEVR